MNNDSLIGQLERCKVSYGGKSDNYGACAMSYNLGINRAIAIIRQHTVDGTLFVAKREGATISYNPVSGLPHPVAPRARACPHDDQHEDCMICNPRGITSEAQDGAAVTKNRDNNTTPNGESIACDESERAATSPCAAMNMGDALSPTARDAVTNHGVSAPSPAQSSEISVVDELEALTEEMRDSNYDSAYRRGIARALAAMRPYLRTTEPDGIYSQATGKTYRSLATGEELLKPVSVAQCAKALWDWEHEGRQNEILAVEWSLLSDDYRENVKVVLDAAGVAYHD